MVHFFCFPDPNACRLSFEIQNQTYELYAVVDHVGDLRGGHYTATIKSQDDDQWYNFSDTRVTVVRLVTFALMILYKPFNTWLYSYMSECINCFIK